MSLPSFPRKLCDMQDAMQDAVQDALLSTPIVFLSLF
jgi:hypothetical protein